MTEKIPETRYADIARYADQYFHHLAAASKTISSGSLRQAADILARTIDEDAWVYVCGNGGSTAISNHLHCDFSNGIRKSTGRQLRVYSLSAHIETMTATANDISYDDVFLHQLTGLGRPGDVLIAISSSGNSENIIRPLLWAKDHGLKTIALTGFDGGRAKKNADISLHIDIHNYGIVEDIHQSIMHVLAQYIRQSMMSPEEIARQKF
ncbi:MAG: SIS domain-containing protein [Telmatospirillum sp.]|nr:SIS domain-containing protein [Telmatospirillum sp.]